MFGRFEDVIIQAGLHRLHGDLFAASPGKHDDRTFGPARFDGHQDPKAITPTQPIIRHHQIPRTASEGQRELAELGDMAELTIWKFPAQRANDQRPIIRVIVH